MNNEITVEITSIQSDYDKSTCSYCQSEGKTLRIRRVTTQNNAHRPVLLDEIWLCESCQNKLIEALGAERKNPVIEKQIQGFCDKVMAALMDTSVIRLKPPTKQERDDFIKTFKADQSTLVSDCQ